MSSSNVDTRSGGRATTTALSMEHSITLSEREKNKLHYILEQIIVHNNLKTKNLPPTYYMQSAPHGAKLIVTHSRHWYGMLVLNETSEHAEQYFMRNTKPLQEVLEIDCVGRTRFGGGKVFIVVHSKLVHLFSSRITLDLFVDSLLAHLKYFYAQSNKRKR